ncbi:methylated-DNA--[protein]-cysteine S-methyltransferase [Rhodococcus rhodochrous]|uniref:Methylated-DNA--protein-cysteine methyltransferase n=1 Tax=Rhodococcus rhodochrous KG-21 TaxID=1441923 RepID=A0A0M8PPG6_RHORH|nr:methylated-DNA--[protein]-cysteine S-methyltransferase [Rhodococcus rhodochrous]KOS56872.1 cysteine methyltransferase [Rhodococcus rhodochrous KG-21]
MNATRTHTVVDSPIGPLTLVRTDGSLSGLYLAEHRHRPGPHAFGDVAATGFEEIIEQLDEYFAGRRTEFTVPLELHGTPFQRRVWQALQSVPYGTVCTYTELAAAVGHPTAVRAVAAANGRNPVSIVVPCHRVIGRDGTLTGYAGGLDRKRYLLDREAQVTRARQ